MYISFIEFILLIACPSIRLNHYIIIVKKVRKILNRSCTIEIIFEETHN